MQIRRVEIQNFRGIQSMVWILPITQRFFTLIGPGDSTKSTILTAIDRALSDRWNISFQDTDFYNSDISTPIRIRVALTELPPELLNFDALGQHLCGITEFGTLTHDPLDGDDVCFVIELSVDADLEPKWFVHRPGDDNEIPVRSQHRSRFGAYRIDERVDTHLRWSRMSALGKLTENRQTKQTLTDANRVARKAVSDNMSEDLLTLATDIQHRMEKIGSANFTNLKPGLDLSMTNANGNLALFEELVPLMNFGLGTRRLAGVATQQLAHPDGALLFVDEVEYGLEPHRLAHLLGVLRQPGSYSQVFITTHSPTALLRLNADELVMVRSDRGTTSMRPLTDPGNLQAMLRKWPTAFLSRRVIIAEGATEVGMTRGLIQAWETDAPAGHVPAAALGVEIVDGQGGPQAANAAKSLLEVGFEVTLFLDADNTDANKLAVEVSECGGVVVQWDGEMETEAVLCSHLDASGLTDFIAAALEVADDPTDAPTTYGDHIHTQLKKQKIPSPDNRMDVTTWVPIVCDLPSAQSAVAAAANKGKWFKNVDRGTRLARFLLDHPQLNSSPLGLKLEELKAGIYQPRLISNSESTELAAPTNTDGPEDPGDIMSKSSEDPRW